MVVGAADIERACKSELSLGQGPHRGPFLAGTFGPIRHTREQRCTLDLGVVGQRVDVVLARDALRVAE